MDKLAAVIDVDGVMYDFVGELARVASIHLRKDISCFPPAEVWNFFSDQWGISFDTYKELVDVGVAKYGLIRYGDEFKDSSRGVATLLECGVKVHIATDLGKDGDENGHRRARLAWLEDIGVDLDEVLVTFTPDKAQVARVYLDQGYDVFALEDKAENYAALEEAGALCYLLDQKWNHFVAGARRVNSVLEFAQLVVN